MSDSMAEMMKKKLSAKNITAIVLFSAIILVFVFFGLPGQMGSGIGSVARVNNSIISLADFMQEETRIQEYYRNLFGDQMDLSSQRELLRQQALESLVRMELVYQATQDQDIMVTDQEVVQFITRDIPVFQQGGQFQRELYGRYLESTRMTPSSFEDKVRKDIANVRSHRLFEVAATPMNLEMAKIKEMRAHKINISFVKIDQDAVLKSGLSPEKFEAAVKALDEALVQGDEAALAAPLKELRGNWEETGYVEYTADSYPKLTSRAATEAVTELRQGEPLLKRLVRDGKLKYVMKLKGFRVEETPEELGPVAVEMIQKRRAEGEFEAWINQFRQRSKVTMNAQALQLN